MYQTSRVLMSCAAAALALSLSACADPATVSGAAGTTGASSSAATSAAGSTAPASTSEAAPTEYGVPTTAAPTPDPTGVATDAPAATDPDDGVSVLVTYAQWDDASATVQAAASVSGVIEDGGTCTLELTRGASTASATGTAVADAASTSCGGLQVPGTQLSSGTWQAVVRYRSDTATGTSDPAEVVVP